MTYVTKTSDGEEILITDTTEAMNCTNLRKATQQECQNFRNGDTVRTGNQSLLHDGVWIKPERFSSDGKSFMHDGCWYKK